MTDIVRIDPTIAHLKGMKKSNKTYLWHWSNIWEAYFITRFVRNMSTAGCNWDTIFRERASLLFLEGYKVENPKTKKPSSLISLYCAYIHDQLMFNNVYYSWVLINQTNFVLTLFSSAVIMLYYNRDIDSSMEAILLQ
jgi:hypothetical protein